MIRFILLATGRTGTTLLGNSLADHPGVLYYGELFHFDPVRRAEEASRATVGAGLPRGLGAGLAACRNDEDGAAYLRRLFSQRTAAGALGFKLFYFQARSGPPASAWEAIGADADLRIVHLQRRNWLESLLSFERARLTGVWHLPGAAPALGLGPMTIEPQRCLQHFERQRQALETASPLLRSHRVLDVEYEEMAAEFPGAMQRVCRFLEVDPAHAGAAYTRKIARLPAREEIANFEELRGRFAGTPYARFFD
ncbi:MAG: sulfotransferase [Burkholderiales bacterium]|nr:sulfotransferase [Burkholderiales bacterium]